MTRSSTALSAKKLTKSAIFATAALAGAASIMAPGTAALANTTTTAQAEVFKVSYSDVLYLNNNGTFAAIKWGTWRDLGFPTPKVLGNIPGTTYTKFGTSQDVIATPPAATPHKMTFGEWVAAGGPTPALRSNEGFIKLSWAPEIARMTNLSTGAGYPLSFTEWKANGFTSFATQQRIKGDQFYRYAGSDTVWYAGPGVNRKISFAEWVGAGMPTPAVRGTVTTTAAAATGSSDQAILNVARKYIGVPYVWGGTTPGGFDCSGFTSYVYRQVGISLPRTSQSQWYAGRVVSKANARPGDLVVLAGGGHIGIYAGGNTMIDAPKPGLSVAERNIWGTPIFVTFR